MAVLTAGCSKGYYDATAPDGGYYVSSNGKFMPGAGDEDPAGGKFDEVRENDFVEVAQEPVSTFSVDADGASYTFIKRYLNTYNGFYNGNYARIEEFINYFPYNYDEPAGEDNVALNSEIGDCPWNPEHKIIRLGLKGKSLKESEIPVANFVFLIDVSGSMSGEDRLDLLKSGLLSMLPGMRPTDRVAIVTYSGSVQKVLESTPVSEHARIESAIKSLAANGSTAGGAAMKMAYEEAEKNFIEGGNNRIIMGTDGDFNVGETSTDAILEMVQNYAKKGIYITICGFGMGNLNDSMMEKVSNKGNGTYEYIGDNDDMTKVFVRERSKFVTVANDCKIQVTFDPQTVSQYRLIGYENRKMANENFDNDNEDAAEIGAGQTVTALYEIVPAEKFEAGCKCARFDFRYKKNLGEESILLGHDVTAEGGESDSFDLACSLAAYGMVLRDSKYKGTSSYELAKSLASAAAEVYDPYGYRADLVSLIDATSKNGDAYRKN